MEEPDELLMRQFQNGDENAFVSLMARYQKKLFNFFLRQSHDHTLSEDLTQDLLVRVFKYGRSFDCQRKFRPWLYRVALNLLRNELRSRARVAQQRNDILDEHELQSMLSPDYRIVQAVKQAIVGLPASQREVLVLKQYQGLTFCEIAEVVGCPEGTVKTRLYQAFAKLRRKLEKYRR